MAKRTAEAERIEELESALAWAMGRVDVVDREVKFYCVHCGWGSAEEASVEEPAMHPPNCPFRCANELLKGLKPRKWETK